MRPRVNSKFGKATYEEIHRYLTDNYVFGLTVGADKNYLVYKFIMLFRSNKQKPEKLYLKVSRTSKLIVEAWTNKGIEFKSINELLEYTKKIN